MLKGVSTESSGAEISPKNSAGINSAEPPEISLKNS
jgi:hypothetical protein